MSDTCLLYLRLTTVEISKIKGRQHVEQDTAGHEVVWLTASTDGQSLEVQSMGISGILGVVCIREVWRRHAGPYHKPAPWNCSKVTPCFLSIHVELFHGLYQFPSVSCSESRRARRTRAAVETDITRERRVDGKVSTEREWFDEVPGAILRSVFNDSWRNVPASGCAVNDQSASVTKTEQAIVRYV